MRAFRKSSETCGESSEKKFRGAEFGEAEFRRRRRKVQKKEEVRKKEEEVRRKSMSLCDWRTLFFYEVADNNLSFCCRIEL